MAEHLLLLPILALAAGNVSGDSALIRKLKKVLLLCREARLRNQRQELLLFLAQVQLSCSRATFAVTGWGPAPPWLCVPKATAAAGARAAQQALR